MALWGNKDNLNIGAAGTVYVSDWDHDGTDGYQITGSGTTFTNFAAGDVIRFGDFKGTYYGDAVIKSISSNTVLTIASTEGTVAAGPLDVQGTVDVQGSLVIL